MSPEKYFRELEPAELEAHFVPLDHALRSANAYPTFIRARRALLAEAMTSLFNQFRPPWLADAAIDVDPLAGCSLKFELYESDWADGQLLVTAREGDTSWDRSQLDVGLGGGNLGGSQRSRR
jgi:hypothetical protein